MDNLWDLTRQQLRAVAQHPFSFVLAGGLALLLGLGAAPNASVDASLVSDLSGRLFFVASGLAAILGYAYAVPLRRVPRQAAGRTISLRSLVLARALSSTCLGAVLTWIGVLCCIGLTAVRAAGLVLPVWEVSLFVLVGVPLIAAAFAGATTLAGLAPRRSIRTLVRWGLFLPGMIAVLAFRLGGGASLITPQILFLTLSVAALLCALEAYVLLRFVPDRFITIPG